MYIDPSIGGQIFQILAIAVTAVSGIVLIFAGRIKMFFARMRRKSEDVVDTDSENQPD